MEIQITCAGLIPRAPWYLQEALNWADVVSVMLMDVSQSMKRHGTAPRDAGNAYLARLRTDTGQRHAAGIVSFGGQGQVVVPVQRVTQTSPAPLTSLETNPGTRLIATLDEVLRCLLEAWTQLSLKQRVRLKVAVGVFSDGANTVDCPGQPESLRRSVNMARDLDWDLRGYAFGLSPQFLTLMTGFPAENVAKLDASAGDILSASTGFADNVSRQFPPKK